MQTITILMAADLFYAMQINGTATVTIKGVTGILKAVARESGDGRSFNVYLDVAGVKQSVFIRF